MLSTPPATTRSPPPALIALYAVPTASMPDPQSLFKVTPGTSTGRPARSAAIRATFRLASPARLAHPYITSSAFPHSVRFPPPAILLRYRHRPEAATLVYIAEHHLRIEAERTVRVMARDREADARPSQAGNENLHCQ